MGKIKPEEFASMTVYRAGSPEAAKYTDSKDKNVIIVDLFCFIFLRGNFPD